MGKTKTSDQPWTVRKEHHDHMAKRQNQNRARNIPAEEWMAAKLATTPWKWTRQARWGFRLYDFWCHQLGIAIEVDGPEHVAGVDQVKDQLDWNRSAILVFRVSAFKEADAVEVLDLLARHSSWNDRRKDQGKSLIAGVV